MKIVEYVNSKDNILNAKNIFRLVIYENQFIPYYTSKFPSKVIFFNYTQQLIHENEVKNNFEKILNRTLLLTNLDIDFPPPKKPYEYDLYFDKSKIPKNYLDIPYADKIDTDIIPLIEKNNNHVFAHAVSINHPNVTMIPGGVFSKFNHFHMKTNEKTILCYANFGLHCDRWFGNPRADVLKSLQTMDFVVKELIADVDAIRRDHLDYNYFYGQISKSKFAICPRGCSFDSYRIYDCICLGCIPIVEKYGGYEQFEDLPILFINSHHDYANLTESFLNNVYDEMMTREYNYDKLTIQHWVDKISKYAN